MNWVQTVVFQFFERRRLRDWFYTVAFIIFVPVGYRFAELAWRYGAWFDRPLAVIAGGFVGITTIVTLTRFWHVSPKQLVTTGVPEAAEPSHPEDSLADQYDQYMVAARRRAAINRDIARGAAVLGSTTGKHW